MSYPFPNSYSYDDPSSFKEDPSWISEAPLHDNIDEIGFDEKALDSSSLFDLSSFEIPKLNKNEKIRFFEVSENVIIIISESNKVFRWRFKDPSVVEYELGEIKEEGVSILQALNPGAMIYNVIKKLPIGEQKKDVVVIDRVFMDPKGFHCFICSDRGENFYLHCQSEKIRYLGKLKGQVVTSVGWNDELGIDSNSTKEMLIGTRDGGIYLYKCDFIYKVNENFEDTFRPLIRLPDKKFAIHIEFVFLTKSQGNKQLCIIVSSNSSLFYFNAPASAGNAMEIVFQNYIKDPENIKHVETPYPKSKDTIMHIFYSKLGQKIQPHSFIRTNGNSINYYKFPEQNEFKDFNFINTPQPLKYAKRHDLDDIKAYVLPEMPLGIALSEFHYFLLHNDCLTVLSKITEKVVKYEELGKYGQVLGMRYEKVKDEIYIYTVKNILKMSIKNEDKEAWKLYMEKNKYKEAYEICKKYNSPYTNYIGGLYADQLLANNEYDKAANIYVENNRNFEETSLKFLMGKTIEGYESFLENWLGKLRYEDKTQRTLLLSLVTELKLYKLNKIENSFQEKINEPTYILAQQKRLKDANEDLQSFLETYMDDIDEKLTFQLMQSHGKFNSCIYFAKAKKNYETIILHHINEEQYKDAINNLRFIKDESVNELLYRYCHVFMKHEPALTVELLQNHIKTKYDPTKLIPALMDIPPEHRQHGINFLKYCIEVKGCKEKTIYNILIFFLSEEEKLDALYDFLRKQEEYVAHEENIHFDLDFALRIFKRKNIVIGQISIYGMMGLYNEAVTLALENNEIEVAKTYAEKPENEDLKKKLWLQIAVHLFNKGTDIEQVIKLTKETNLIKIEDLLPYFNENIKIEHFKEEICNSLNEYNSQIESLKAEMEGYSNNAEQLKNDLRNLKNKYIVIESSQKCDECDKSIYSEEFYIFPCLHGFHKSCLLKRIEESPTENEKFPEIEEINKKIQLLLLKASTNSIPQSKRQERNSATSFFFGFLAGKQSVDKIVPVLTIEEERLLKEYKERYDFLVASGCLNCSSSVVDSIYILFDSDERQKQSWELKA